MGVFISKGGMAGNYFYKIGGFALFTDHQEKDVFRRILLSL